MAKISNTALFRGDIDFIDYSGAQNSKKRDEPIDYE